jgi:exodeoxyribonuclease VII small subunit
MINMKYQDAYNELQEIVSEIEAGEIGIDEISEKVKRASELIEVCKAKLFQTEQDVDQILKNLEQPED